jgi:hypothetical protein
MGDPNYARSVLGAIRTPGGAVADIADVQKNIYAAEVSIRREKHAQKIEARQDEDWPAHVIQREFGLETIKHTREQWAEQQKSQNRETASRAYAEEITFNIMAGNGLNKVKLLELAKIDYARAIQMQEAYHTHQVRQQEVITDKNTESGMWLKVAADPHSISATDIFLRQDLDMPAKKQLWSEIQRLQKETPEERDPFFKTSMDTLIRSVSINKEGAQTGSSIADAGTAAMIFRNAWNESKDLPHSERMLKAEELRYKLLERYNPTAFELSKKGQAASLETAEKANRTYLDPRTNEQAIIPESHIQKLMKNPGKTEDFDKVYGKGSAKRLLDSAGIQVPQQNKPKPVFDNTDLVYKPAAPVAAPAPSPVAAPAAPAPAAPTSKNQYHFPKGTAERTRLDAVSQGGDFDKLSPADKDRIFKAMFPDAVK